MHIFNADLEIGNSGLGWQNTFAEASVSFLQ